MKALIKKEISYYINNPVGYIIVVLYAVFINYMFLQDTFLNGYISFKGFFSLAPWLLMVFVPAISMRLFAEEKKSNTIEILHTLPVTEVQIYISKLISVIFVVFIAQILTFGFPIFLFVSGLYGVGTYIYLPEIAIAYLGIIMYALATASISLFFSSQTKNQIIALITSIISLFVLNLVGTDFVNQSLPHLFQKFLEPYSAIYHYNSFVKGVVDLRAVFYFVSISAIFSTFTIYELLKRE